MENSLLAPLPLSCQGVKSPDNARLSGRNTQCGAVNSVIPVPQPKMSLYQGRGSGKGESPTCPLPVMCQRVKSPVSAGVSSRNTWHGEWCSLGAMAWRVPPGNRDHCQEKPYLELPQPGCFILQVLRPRIRETLAKFTSGGLRSNRRKNSTGWLDEPRDATKRMPEVMKSLIRDWRGTLKDGERQIRCPHFFSFVTDGWQVTQ